MHTRNRILFAVVAACIYAVIFSTNAFADNAVTGERLKVSPVAVYQAIHGQYLAETLANIAQRSGISFKINTDISQDVISQSLAADSWHDAIKTLLAGYNYTTVQQGDTIKTVIITGRNNDATNNSIAATSVDQVIIVEPKLVTLPAKYRDFPAASVTAVNLPVNTMMNVADQAIVSLELPMGQFNVAHDFTVNELDGSRTWVGYLADEGQGYRVFLSQGDAGVMGMITTPDGSYNIESVNNTVYLVDTSKLQHAGFEGDAIAPTKEMLHAMVANAMTSQVNQLQNAVTADQVALTAANALVSKYVALVTTDKANVTATQTTLTAVNSKLLIALANYNNAVVANRFKASAASKLAVNNASVALVAAKAAASLAGSNYQVANKKLLNDSYNLALAQTAAQKALANYNQALSAFNAANNTVSAPASISAVPASASANTNPVVDLMVVYTTVGQTQAYAKQRISFLVTASNQAYVDSKINMQLRLVHTEATSYAEDTSNSQALQDLSNGNNQFASISQTRSQYGADLVFLFRPLYAKAAGSCGTTYVEFASGSAANASLGFGTISDGNAVDQSGYFCAANTFTHEIGHSLGLVHDREYTSYPGVFNYSYAWGVDGSFGTIMSYKTPLLMVFSNPALTKQCAGQACGYAKTDSVRGSDQASSVNYTAPIVANFMPTTTAAPILN